MSDFSNLTRGDVVRPNAEAIRLTNFIAASRLVVRVNHGGGDRACSACVKAKLEEWGSRGSDWMGNRDALAAVGGAAGGYGRLYAAGAETSAPLCLAHVEPVEGQR